ncbi:MAG: hypothetical protein PHQ18_02345 [Patescibacteria group bacterium]|nr:hypothetical protein [Patescibacteria group bacterium]
MNKRNIITGLVVLALVVIGVYFFYDFVTGVQKGQAETNEKIGAINTAIFGVDVQKKDDKGNLLFYKKDGSPVMEHIPGAIEDFDSRIKTNATNITTNKTAIEAQDKKFSSQDETLETNVKVLQDRMKALDEAADRYRNNKGGRVTVLETRVSAWARRAKKAEAKLAEAETKLDGTVVRVVNLEDQVAILATTPDEPAFENFDDNATTTTTTDEPAPAPTPTEEAPVPAGPPAPVPTPTEEVVPTPMPVSDASPPIVGHIEQVSDGDK